MICARCGQDKEPFERDLCEECVKAENCRLTYYRQHQGDWIAAATEQGLAPWLQQPGETQWEYTLWTKYRDSYPGKKPTYAAVAAELKTTYNVVHKVAQRWSFQARMQIWMTECDRITMLQRKDEILGMNKDHITMAAKLRAKLDIAIDMLDPMMLKPSEVASLAKLSTDLERKARLDTEAQEALRRDLVVDTTNSELKKTPTKPGDLSEIVQILLKAGVLTAVGVKETVTREAIMVQSDE